MRLHPAQVLVTYKIRPGQKTALILGSTASVTNALTSEEKKDGL